MQAESNENAGLQAIRNVTEQYRDVNKALRDGFTADTHCVESPLGAMGYHYINFQRLNDGIDWKQPEVLLYRDGQASGGKVLTGVEYLVVDADQDKTTVERHEVFGHRLKGPMDGHGPGMPIHYDRHAWAWQSNPSGAWADWNPTVSCPSH